MYCYAGIVFSCVIHCTSTSGCVPTYWKIFNADRSSNGMVNENNKSMTTDLALGFEKKDKNIELFSQPPIATAAVPVGEPGKKKKKKRKAVNSEGEITEAKATLHQPADGQGSVPDQPEKRKKKKNKSVQPSGEPELAAVGDRELARSGKPILKELYTEHAAVAALTPAEVDAWRAERETVVTGRGMKPVIAFGQAGEPLFYGTFQHTSV